MAPPVRTKNPVRAQGDRLVSLRPGSEDFVVEVETDQHGTLAVGVADGEPFAVSNVCRHQFAKLGQGQIREGCLECPWHRARYDVQSGVMVSGPKGRIFGFPPYSRMIQLYNNAAFRLRRFPVEVRDDAIYLAPDVQR
ncbi:MAG TPA: Rieske (2Fe-2S) protein [Solirubrobacteraceae bacterium]|jgi:nitrite reductase/ring-hydroxylating ferredoxin subunit